MGAQTKGNMADPRQRQMVNEGIRMRRESARSNEQGPQEQEMVEREQQQRAQQQAMAERMQAQRGAPAGNTPTPGSGIAFGPGRSNRGDIDLRKLLQDRMTRGN